MNIIQFFREADRVLGMNTRNLDYTTPYNPPQSVLLAIDKLKTKTCLASAGLPISPTLGVISQWQEVRAIKWDDLPPGFVVKPVSSSQGKGVLVVFGKSKKRPDTWIKSDGTGIHREHIETHLFNILGGTFSDTGDRAFIEERVKIHPLLKPYARRGTPDIRVIVFNSVPVMAELRLPTVRSEGRSNLHMGGIGIGIDLALGITTHAIYLGQPIRTLPGTRTLLSGVAIPSWDKVLLLAVEAQKATGLGFAGIDIGVDPQGHPLVFEVNARPGLAIQSANRSGLRQHLERVKGLHIKSARHGVSIAQALFGGDVTRQLEITSGRKIVGIFEPIEIQTPKGLWSITAKLDTGAYSSSVDEDLLKKLGIKKQLLYSKVVKSTLGEEVRHFVPLTFFLKGEKIETEVSVTERSESRYQFLIGRKDLRNFLLDPSRKKPKMV